MIKSSVTTHYTLSTQSSFETLIRKSRFLALATSIQTPEDGLRFIATQTVADASHNCWAYRLGDLYRFSDDGEPGGTAGRPILQSIDGQQCDRVVVLIARWFGGVKLGTGGLARAYGGTAAQCLRQAAKIALVDMVRMDCTCPFTDMALVRSRLGGFDARILQETFDAQGALWQLELPRIQVTGFLDAFRQWTRGQGRAQIDRR